MKSKLLRLACCCLIALGLLTSAWPVSAEEHARAVDEAQALIDDIVAYKLAEAGASSVQQWIDGALTGNAGSSEWYAIALSQYQAYDLTAYEKALVKYLSENKVPSASSRQKYALALIASGSGSSYIHTTLNDSIGQQGVMSWSFGLQLLNNGYTSDAYSLKVVKETLLSLQLEDGGWAVMGSFGEVDTTAMAVQALAPYYTGEPSVKAAVDKALTLLSDRQLATGEYTSYGVSCPESAAQVLVALSSLGIDCTADSRFIKNGNTLFDGIRRYRLSDGSFCHTLGGGANEAATVQVLYSMVAYLRMKSGKSGLYILDAADPAAGQDPTGSTSTGTAVPPVSTEASAGSYKVWVCLAILLAAGGTCAVLFLLKKRNGKNFLMILVVAGLAITVVLLTTVQSPEDYYHTAGTSKPNAVGTVTLTIRCDAIPDKSATHIPADGIILEATRFEIDDGDTVYDILREATGANKLHLETSGGTESVYVKGIGNIYEFDFGDLSGWIYRVNGERPSASCGSYTVSPGDRIEWLYSCTLGNDLE